MPRLPVPKGYPVSRSVVIGLTASDRTEPCATSAKHRLEAAGYAVRRYEADEPSGKAFEASVHTGLYVGVLDLTTAELAAELRRGTAVSNRLTAAALAGIPQVISLGGLDGVAPDSRTTPEENDRLGYEIAMKACAARGPTAIVVPLRGLSSLDVEGGPHWWPEANAALFQSLRNWVYGVELIELDLHVNDPEFGVACAETLLRLLRGTIVRE